MLKTGFFHRWVGYYDDPAKDSDWVAKESLQYGGVNSAKWRREMEGDWNIYGGQRVWPMLSRTYHNLTVILDENWAIYRIIDHGIRHPTCCLWCAINHNGDRHFYKEYYATDKSVAINCRQILSMTPEKERVIKNVIDPSTRKRVNYLTSAAAADKKGLCRLVDLYEENGLPCDLADNSAAGYDKVTDGLLSQLARYALRTGDMPQYLFEMKVNQEQLLMLAAKPAISFDLRNVSRAFNETENLRWQELSGDMSQRSEPEKTVDVADEGPDCVRYAIQSELCWRRPYIKFEHGSYRDELIKRRIRTGNKAYRKWA